MTHTPPRPSCWTESATPRLWLITDKAKYTTHAWMQKFQAGRVEASLQPDYRDENRVCKAYDSLAPELRAACVGCARIGGEA